LEAGLQPQPMPEQEMRPARGASTDAWDSFLPPMINHCDAKSGTEAEPPGASHPCPIQFSFQGESGASL